MDTEQVIIAVWKILNAGEIENVTVVSSTGISVFGKNDMKRDCYTITIK